MPRQETLDVPGVVELRIRDRPGGLEVEVSYTLIGQRVVQSNTLTVDWSDTTPEERGFLNGLVSRMLARAKTEEGV